MRSVTIYEDRVIAVILICASAAYGFAAFGMTGLRSDDPMGSGGFPLIIAVTGVGLGVWLFFETREADDAPTGPTFRAWLFWLLIVLYALSLPVVGFGIASLLFLLVSFRLLKAGWIWAVTISTAVTGALWLLFAQLLGIRLPLMPWG